MLKLILLLGIVFGRDSWCIFIDFILVVMLGGVKVIIIFGLIILVFILLIGIVLIFILKKKKLNLKVKEIEGKNIIRIKLLLYLFVVFWYVVIFNLFLIL